jgi:shikimate dehydrogenase
VRERYGVVGNPVAHSKSPWIHAQFARETGQELDYVRIEAPLEGFEAALDAFIHAGGKGLNVTLPFKEQAFRYCRATSTRARAAGAVNTLVLGQETYGDNTDGVGLVRDLTINLACPLEHQSVLLMGAGGAARGVIQALVDARIERLVIANRTAQKARSLAERVPGAIGSGYGELAGQRFDIVINATSSGLTGEMPKLPDGVLRRGALAYEMVYGRETPFLSAARASGARTCDGLGMLVEQAAESFLLWRGVRPATAPVLAALRAA